MPLLHTAPRCPSCARALQPRVLACDTCAVKMEGHFTLNEFATLDGDDLNFLRVFVRAEGRIREMEGSLDLSYPTVRSRLADLKRRLEIAQRANLSWRQPANPVGGADAPNPSPTASPTEPA